MTTARAPEPVVVPVARRPGPGTFVVLVAPAIETIILLAADERARFSHDFPEVILLTYILFGLSWLVAGLTYGAWSRLVRNPLIALPGALVIGFVFSEGSFRLFLLAPPEGYYLMQGVAGAMTLGLCAIVLDAWWLRRADADESGKSRWRERMRLGSEDSITIKIAFWIGLVPLTIATILTAMGLVGDGFRVRGELREILPVYLTGLALLVGGCWLRGRTRWIVWLLGVTLAVGMQIAALFKALSSI